MSSATVLVDAGQGAKLFKALRPQVVSRPDDVPASVEGGGAGILWILARTKHLTEFVAYWSAHPRGRSLLSLEPVDSPRAEVLRALFDRVVIKQEGVRLLAHDEIAEVLAADTAADLFIGGRVDTDDQVIMLYRGNLEPLLVPFATFQPSPGGAKPDFKKFDIIDFGHTIRLGEYEAAADAVLYEVDREYRRRTKKSRLQNDQSFGACMRRLRLQKGLNLTDFAPHVTEKEVGRIERGEVKNPHRETLAKIAKKLAVAVEEIESY